MILLLVSLGIVVLAILVMAVISSEHKLCSVDLITARNELHPLITIRSSHEGVEIPSVFEPVFKSNTEQLIPRVIIQTNSGKKVPTGIKVSIDKILEHNPEYEYRYFDDDDCVNFLKENFSERVCRAFDKLVPGAFKSDLFRACYLLKKGGVYMDTGFVSLVPLREWIRPNDKFLSPEDNLRTTSNDSYIHNAFMASIPDQPVLLEYLKIALKRIEDNDYSYGLHGITGPRVMGLAFDNVFGKLKPGDFGNGVRVLRSVYNDRLRTAIISEEVDPSKVILSPLLYSKSLVYRSEQRNYNQPHYCEYVDGRQVFGEPGFLKRLSEKCVEKSPSIGNGPVAFAHNFALESYKTVKIHSHVPKSLESSYSQKIPKVLVQTDNKMEVPINMSKAMKTFKYLNPEYEIFYFDEEGRRNFIRDNFDSRILQAYDTLVPKAFRADLFRLCYLLRNGGIYCDSSNVAITPFRKFIEPTDEFVAAEDNGTSKIRGHPHIYNAFMACIPNHPLIKRSLEKAIENIEKRDYSKTDLGITGPRCIGEAFEEIYKVRLRQNQNYDDDKVRIISVVPSKSVSRIITDGKEYAGVTNRVLIYTKYNDYYKDRKKYSKGELSYGSLFSHGLVYK